MYRKKRRKVKKKRRARCRKEVASCSTQYNCKYLIQGSQTFANPACFSSKKLASFSWSITQQVLFLVMTMFIIGVFQALAKYIFVAKKDKKINKEAKSFWICHPTCCFMFWKCKH